MENFLMKSCVLAYSGGLDTSVILGWLQDHTWVHAVYVDLGQPCEDREAIMEKARNGGVSSRIIDAREEMCRDFAFPVLAWRQSMNKYICSGHRSRVPSSAKFVFKSQKRWGRPHTLMERRGRQRPMSIPASSRSVGSQNRNHRAAAASAIPEAFPGRTELIEYCESKNIPVKASTAKSYSSDENVLHISYEAGDLEELDVNGVELVDFGMGVSPQEALMPVSRLTSDSSRVFPRHNGSVLMLGNGGSLERVAGRNGIGRIDMVENRFVGMKSRGVYESPGMTVLYDALMYVEQLAMDRDRLILEIVSLQKLLKWFTTDSGIPQMDAS